jgi:hypothetical protein
MLIPIILIVGVLLAIDTFAFHGDYRRAAWLEAQDQGKKINDEVRQMIRKWGF